MTPEIIVSKLNLSIKNEHYGNSINSGAQVACFNNDSTVHLFSGGPTGAVYKRSMYRIEKKHVNNHVRLLVHHEDILKADTGIGDKLIKHANSTEPLNGLF